MLRYPLSVTLDTNIFDAAKYDFDQNSVCLLYTSPSPRDRG